MPATHSLDPGHLCLSLAPCSGSVGPPCLLGPHRTFTSVLSLEPPPRHSYSVNVLSSFLLQVPCTNRLVAIVGIVATPASRSCCLLDQRVCVCVCHQTISCSTCCPSISLSCDYFPPLPCFIFLLTASAICHYSSLFVSFLYYKAVSLRAMLVTRGHC